MDVIESMRNAEKDEVRDLFEAAVQLLKRTFKLYK